MACSARVLLTVTLSLLPLAGFAQDSAALSGLVTELSTGKPLADVEVTASSAALLAPRSVTSDGAGVFVFSQLPPGAYSLEFRKPTFKPLTRGEANVRLGVTLRVNVQLQPEGSKEEVLAVGPAPAVDVGSPQQGVSLSRGFLERVPLLTPSVTGARTFEDLARAAPQVTADRFGYGISGSQATEHLFLVDGLQVNDPTTGALRTGVGLGGAQLPLEFLEETSVVTGGLSPAFGRATGGLLSVQTKSGSNVTRGAVWGSWFPGAFTAAGPTLRTVGSSLELDARRHNTGDFGAELGGALIQDRLWFYAAVAQAVDRQRVTRGVRRFLLTDDGQDFLYDGESGDIRSERIAQSSRFDDRRAFTWLGKLTLRIDPTQTLSLSVFGSPQQRSAPAFEPLAASGTLATSTSTSASLRYAGRFFQERLLVDATAGWTRTEQARLPGDGARLGETAGAAGVPQTTFRSERPLSLREFEALPLEIADLCEPPGFSASRRVTFRGVSRFVMACPVTGSDAAYTLGGPGLLEDSVADRLQARGTVAYRFEALGHHVARAGVDLDFTQARLTRALSGAVALTGTGPVGSPLDAQANAFPAAPNELVPLLSVRSAASQLSTGAFVQDSWNLLDAVTVNAGLRYDSQQLFGTTGQPGLALNHVFSPRVGFVYDFTQQGRSRLFGNYAMYQQALPLDAADRALNGSWQARTRTSCNPVADAEGARLACADAANALPLSADPLAPSPDSVQLAAGRAVVDPALRPMTKGEVTAGLEYEVFANLRVGLIGTHAWLMQAVEDVSVDEGATRFLGNPGAGLASSLPRADRRYFAGTLFVSRAFADGWLVQSSYTLSSLSGNYAGFLRPETGQLAPGFTSAFDGQALTANQTGPLPADQTHLIRAYAAKDFEVSSTVTVLAGLGYEGSSGRPISYLAFDSRAGLDQAYVLPRGVGGRTPWLHTVNARAGVLFKVTPTQAVQVTLDVFNLFNAQEAIEVSERFSTAGIVPANLPPGTDPQEAACLSGNDPTCRSVLQKRVGATLAPVQSTDLNPNFKQPTLYQQPLSVRLGVKLSF